MTAQRFDLARQAFDQAVDALARALAQPEDEFVRDAIIKRFELCFETGRKAMRRWLTEQDELTDADTKKALMEAAYRTGLITDADLWSELNAARNDTTHEYNQAKATAIIALVRQRGLDAFEQLRSVLAERG